MARFGTGINASLGAINYAPYMQGAVAGSQSIAQGIASLGQAASGAINTYYAKKEEDKKKEEAANSFIKTVEANPAAFQGYFKDGKVDKEAIRTMVDTIGFQGTLQLNTYLAESAKQQKAETERLASKKDDDQVNELLQAESMGMLDQVLPKATPAARAKFEQVRQQQQAQGVQLDLARSQIAENLAQARAAGMPKVETPGVEEAQVRAAMRAEAQRVNRQLTAAEEDAIRTRVAESRRSSTTFDMGQKGKERENVFNQFKDERKASIEPILKSDRASRRLGELLDSGKLIAGSTANIELPIKSIANDLGVGDFPEARNTQEYMALIGQAVARNISAFGAGTAISNADREYAERISGGDITVTPEVLRRLQQILNDASRDTLEQYNSRLSDVFGSDDVYYKSLRVRENDAPFFFGKVAAKPVSGVIRDGKILRN